MVCRVEPRLPESIRAGSRQLFCILSQRGREIDARVGNSTDGLRLVYNVYDLRMNVIPPLLWRMVITLVSVLQCL